MLLHSSDPSVCDSKIEQRWGIKISFWSEWDCRSKRDINWSLIAVFTSRFHHHQHHLVFDQRNNLLNLCLRILLFGSWLGNYRSLAFLMQSNWKEAFGAEEMRLWRHPPPLWNHCVPLPKITHHRLTMVEDEWWTDGFYCTYWRGESAIDQQRNSSCVICLFLQSM